MLRASIRSPGFSRIDASRPFYLPYCRAGLNRTGMLGCQRERLEVDPGMTRDPLLQPFRLKHLMLKNRIMSTAQAHRRAYAGNTAAFPPRRSGETVSSGHLACRREDSHWSENVRPLRSSRGSPARFRRMRTTPVPRSHPDPCFSVEIMLSEIN